MRENAGFTGGDEGLPGSCRREHRLAANFGQAHPLNPSMNQTLSNKGPPLDRPGRGQNPRHSQTVERACRAGCPKPKTGKESPVSWDMDMKNPITIHIFRVAEPGVWATRPFNAPFRKPEAPRRFLYIYCLPEPARRRSPREKPANKLIGANRPADVYMVICATNVAQAKN